MGSSQRSQSREEDAVEDGVDLFSGVNQIKEGVVGGVLGLERGLKGLHQRRPKNVPLLLVTTKCGLLVAKGVAGNTLDDVHVP